jgi:hypothetical protein
LGQIAYRYGGFRRCCLHITLNPEKIIGYLRIMCFALVKYLRKNDEAVHHLFTYLKKNYDSFRREALYNTLTEICIPMKLISAIKVCQNETYSRIREGKHFSDTLLVKE